MRAGESPQGQNIETWGRKGGGQGQGAQGLGHSGDVSKRVCVCVCVCVCVHVRVCVCVHVHMCTHSQLCPTLCNPWTVARQAPLSMGFSWQECCSGLPLLSPADLPNPGIKLVSPESAALARGFFTTNVTWEATHQEKETGNQKGSKIMFQ